MATSAVETTETAAGDVAKLPAAGATAEQRREQAREAILVSTWVALVRDGYEKITTRRIAEIAGVNIATLHYYFGTKEALLTEATRFAMKDAEQRVKAAMQEAPSAPDALRRVFDTIWDLVKERPGILRFDLVVRGFRDDTARREVLAIYATYKELMRHLVERHLCEGGQLASGLTAATVAHYLVAAIDGVLLQHVLTGDDDTARDALNLICSHALGLLNVVAAE